jgi:hypothetical protein
MLEMRRLVSLVLLLCYGFMFLNMSTALAFGPVAKIKVTHSHDHGSDQHHHDSPVETGNTDPKPNPRGGNQHSHEISVGNQVAMTSNEIPVIRVVITTENLKFTQANVRVPKSPALLGIFRPPIA